jgi:hypothetical protein
MPREKRFGNRCSQTAREVRPSFTPVKTPARKGAALCLDPNRVYPELLAKLLPTARKIKIASLRDQQPPSEHCIRDSNTQFDPRGGRNRTGPPEAVEHRIFDPWPQPECVERSA